MPMTRDEIYKKVQTILVNALGVDEEEVKPDAVIRDDLGAESIDFLDIMFRLEKTFGIKIPKGEMYDETLANEELREGRQHRDDQPDDAGDLRVDLRRCADGMAWRVSSRGGAECCRGWPWIRISCRPRSSGCPTKLSVVRMCGCASFRTDRRRAPRVWSKPTGMRRS